MKKITLMIALMIVIMGQNGVSTAQTSNLKNETAAAASVQNGNEPAGSSEVEVKDYKPRQKDKDPFQVLVTPPAPVVIPQPVKNDNVKPPLPEVQPLPLKVTFIVGGSNRRFANIDLNNKVNQYTDGEQEESGLFKVIEVLDRTVKVWDSRVNKERTLNLNE